MAFNGVDGFERCGMGYGDFLNAIIDDGMEAARADYGLCRAGRAADTTKLSGALAGFEQCRGKEPAGIAALLVATARDREQARRRQADDYWYWRCREAETLWVANVLSAAFLTAGLPPLVSPTHRGLLRMMAILGYQRVHEP